MKPNIIILFMVKLGITGKSIDAFITYVRNIVVKMTGNTDFPTPEPTLAFVTGLIDDLDDANQDALNGGAEKILLRDQIYQLAKKAVTELGVYVEFKAKGDVVKIAGSGFEHRKPAAPLPPLGQVLGLKAIANIIHGMVDLKWKRVKGARVYGIFMCDDIVAGNWVLIGKSTKVKFSITDLQSGQQYWFKVAAVGVGDDGADSDPATTFVL